MNPKELRLGNLIRWDLNNPKEDNQPDQGYTDCEVNLWSIYSDYDRCSPIPLTEDWLIKFGFKKGEFKHTEHRYSYNDLCISKIKDTFIWSFYDCFADEVSDYGEIKWVHQLQNLYFALTNNELLLH